MWEGGASFLEHEFNGHVPVNGGHIELIEVCKHDACIQMGINAALIRAGSKPRTHVLVYISNLAHMRRVYSIT